MDHLYANLDANYKYYEIDLADIWNYEREKFLAGGTELYFAQRIIDVIQRLIIKNGESSFGEEMRDLDPNYYGRNALDYHEADLKTKYALNYFFHKNDCFEYSQSILITINEDDFSLLFSLKLSQYNYNLETAERFLQSQFLSTFNNDITNFKKFLKRIIRQSALLFTPGLCNEVEDLIRSSEFAKNGESNGINSNKAEKTSNANESMDTDPNSQKTYIDNNRSGNGKENSSISSYNEPLKETLRIWIGTGKQLDILYTFINRVLIDDIASESFKNHFMGVPCQDKLNWIAYRNVFIELFDELASAKKLNPLIVKPNNQFYGEGKSVVVINKFISHFTFNGIILPSYVLNNVRSRLYRSKVNQSTYHNDILQLIETIKD